MKSKSLEIYGLLLIIKNSVLNDINHRIGGFETNLLDSGVMLI